MKFFDGLVLLLIFYALLCTSAVLEKEVYHMKMYVFLPGAILYQDALYKAIEEASKK